MLQPTPCSHVETLVTFTCYGVSFSRRCATAEKGHAHKRKGVPLVSLTCNGVSLLGHGSLQPQYRIETAMRHTQSFAGLGKESIVTVA